MTYSNFFPLLVPITTNNNDGTTNVPKMGSGGSRFGKYLMSYDSFGESFKMRLDAG